MLKKPQGPGPGPVHPDLDFTRHCPCNRPHQNMSQQQVPVSGQPSPAALVQLHGELPHPQAQPPAQHTLCQQLHHSSNITCTSQQRPGALSHPAHLSSYLEPTCQTQEPTAGPQELMAKLPERWQTSKSCWWGNVLVH